MALAKEIQNPSGAPDASPRVSKKRHSGRPRRGVKTEEFRDSTAAHYAFFGSWATKVIGQLIQCLLVLSLHLFQFLLSLSASILRPLPHATRKASSAPKNSAFSGWQVLKEMGLSLVKFRVDRPISFETGSVLHKSPTAYIRLGDVSDRGDTATAGR